MIVVAVGAVWGWQRCTRPAWRYVAIGAVAWVVGVALKFAWAMPTNEPIRGAIQHLFGSDLGRPISWLYTGLLTGIFECGATWLLVRWTRVRSADRSQAIAFGLGFGAMEALLLGIIALVGMASAVLFFDQIPADAQAKLVEQTSSLWSIPLPVAERISAIAGHAVSCVLVVWSVQQRRALWFWASFGYKTILDGLAAWGVDQFGVKTSTVRLGEFNLILAFYVGASVVVLLHLRKRVNSTSAEMAPVMPRQPVSSG